MLRCPLEKRASGLSASHPLLSTISSLPPSPPVSIFFFPAFRLHGPPQTSFSCRCPWPPCPFYPLSHSPDNPRTLNDPHSSPSLNLHLKARIIRANSPVAQGRATVSSTSSPSSGTQAIMLRFSLPSSRSGFLTLQPSYFLPLPLCAEDLDSCFTMRKKPLIRSSLLFPRPDLQRCWPLQPVPLLSSCCSGSSVPRSILSSASSYELDCHPPTATTALPSQGLCSFRDAPAHTCTLSLSTR